MKWNKDLNPVEFNTQSIFCLFVLQAVAGLLADARSLSEVAREEASNFRSNYGHDIPLKVRDIYEK